MSTNQTPPTLIELDPWLTPYAGAIEHRNWLARERQRVLTQERQTLADFAGGHEYFGLHRTAAGWVLRERAPNATRISVIGDFTEWKLDSQYDLIPKEHGTWELCLPPHALRHGQHYKLMMFWREDGRECSAERIPSFCRRVTQDPQAHHFLYTRKTQ